MAVFHGHNVVCPSLASCQTPSFIKRYDMVFEFTCGYCWAPIIEETVTKLFILTDNAAVLVRLFIPFAKLGWLQYRMILC